MLKSKEATTLLITLLILTLFGSLIMRSLAENEFAEATFGNTAVGDIGLRFGTNKDANKFQLTEHGTIESITVYFVTSVFNAKAAIYSDSNGMPDSLIAQSISEWIIESGWHTFAVPEKLLSPGYYWLCVVSDRTRAFGTTISGGSSQHVMGDAYYMGEFESSFGTSIWNIPGSTSIYATYIPAAPSTPLPSPPPSPSPEPTPPTQDPTPEPPTPIPTPDPAPEPPSPVLSFGTYWDQACTNKASSITWGKLTPGATKKMALYVRNEGNTPITLYEGTINWNPNNAANFITLDWDYGNQSLSAGSVTKVTLTLTVSISIAAIKDFSFDTSITATG